MKLSQALDAYQPKPDATAPTDFHLVDLVCSSRERGCAVRRSSAYWRRP